MKRLFVALVAAAAAAIGPALTASAFPPQTTVATHAISWLHGQQAADGTVAGSASRTEDTVLGLVANGQSIDSFSTNGKTAMDSLRAHIADEEKTAGNIGGLVMAVSAAAADPTTFAGRNLLQDLACTYNASTGSYNDQLFNDALAVLALPAGSAPAKAVAFLTDKQQPDGGWEFSAPYGSDTNTTAIVVLALTSANGMTTVVKDRVLAYLKTQQKSGGGFEYASGSADSDPNSDAAVIQVLLAMGEDPAGPAWTVDGKNALADLLTFQFDNGGFGFARPSSSQTAAPDPLSTTQALVALASKYLPVKQTEGAMPSTCPSVPTGTPAPTPTPVATPSASQLARTGSPPVGAFVGLLLIVLGWRLRRRAA
jgi:hypothetical protein